MLYELHMQHETHCGTHLHAHYCRATHAMAFVPHMKPRRLTRHGRSCLFTV